MKVICVHAFACPRSGECKHAAPHDEISTCSNGCTEYDDAYCAPPLFYLTEKDLCDRIEEVLGRERGLHLPNILTVDEFQSVAEDVYQQLMNVWREEMDEVITEALEFVQCARGGL